MREKCPELARCVDSLAGGLGHCFGCFCRFFDFVSDHFCCPVAVQRKEPVPHLALQWPFLLAPRAGLPSTSQKPNEIKYFCNRFDNPNLLNRDIEAKGVLPCGVKPPHARTTLLNPNHREGRATER